ncbi:large conductance mechanosensitive channel [Mycobacteroides chelonae]|nr:large conductance mechanosensitive channel [Mycobacteroides chelonae]
MLKGFRDFLLRGNVIDLAVAVVIGAAFTALVTKFSEAIIQPLINRIGTGSDSDQPALKVGIGGGQYLDFNVLITATINFILIAIVVYFLIVLPYKTLKDRLETTGEDPAAATEAELLVEIRDLLAEQKKAS